MRHILKFALPVLIWAFFLRDFLAGAIPLNMDTNTIYGVTKYYFNNVLNGVIPLWEPFVGVGRPFYALAICNLFNPVTLLVPLLKVLGLNYHIAFNVYMAVYFWVGCLGFYFLVKRLLGDRWLAYLGYVALMFSSLGVSLFTQFTFVEIIVPAIWFFYFLLSFAQERTRGHFLGVCFSLMVILGAYLPFYFLTVFGTFLIIAVPLYRRETWDFLKHAGTFLWHNRTLALSCAIGIAIAALPLLSYKMLDASGDSVSPGRHCQYTSVQECYDRTLNQQGGMLYQEIARSGGLGERLDVGYLFTHLDKMTYGSDSFFFVPVVIYILLALSLLLRLTRLSAVITVMMALIGLIALGESAPLHKFLFDNIFFFSYFRNLFFLGAFFLPLLIILALHQLQSLLNMAALDLSGRKAAAVWVVAVHAALWFALHQLGGVMAITFITLGLSVAVSLAYVLGLHRWGMKVWGWVLAALVIAQPAAVMAAYSANAVEFTCPMPSMHVKPVFAWTRPDKAATSACRIYQFVPYEDFWYAMSMTDAPARVGYPQATSRWAFMLSQQIGDDAVSAYAKYKVYLYDDLQRPGTALEGPTKEVDVTHFDVNRVAFKVNADRPRWLVYNDAYTSAWKATVDGQPVALTRANGAFKAVQVPAGEHMVEFSYHPPGGQWAYVLTACALFIFLGLTVLMLYWKK